MPESEMKILLPLATPEASAKVFATEHLRELDDEILRVYNFIMTDRVKTDYHRMWEYDVGALVRYGFLIAMQYLERTGKDTFLPPWLDLGEEHPFDGWPLFTMDILVNYSHQSYLVRTWPDLYSHVFPDMESKLPELWSPLQVKERKVIADAIAARSMSFSDTEDKGML